MNYNNDENPLFLNDYLMHIKVVRMLSERTVGEYYLDIRLFLKYIASGGKNVEDADISHMTVSELRKITISDIYSFVFYTADERRNADKARYRKISALRSFFKYLTKTTHLLNDDPTKDIEVPSPKAALPKYLTLEESKRLLTASESADSARNYCIITLFLNCGMRLSELIGINVSDVDFYDNKLKVLGKGNKERMIFLNDACVDAIRAYLNVRSDHPRASEEPALFISNRGTRISKRRVQQIVEDTLAAAELSGKGLSTHKLRHTAATLMYQYGDADILTLKELLGHAHTTTTEVYTHLNSQSLRNAVEDNPLAQIKRSKHSKKDT